MNRFENRPSQSIRNGYRHLVTAVVGVVIFALHRALANHEYTVWIESALSVTIMFTSLIGASLLAENLPAKPFKPVSHYTDLGIILTAVVVLGIVYAGFQYLVAPAITSSVQKGVLTFLVNLVCGLAIVATLGFSSANAAMKRVPRAKPAINP